MKLAQIINCESKFARPYKVYSDDVEVEEGYQLIADNIYEANYCFVICENGEFEYDIEQKEGIIAIQNNRPFIFATKDNKLIEKIPFDSKVSFDRDNIMVRGVFAIEKNSTATVESCKKDFEQHLLNDLLNSVGSQIDGLQKIQDKLKEKLNSIN